MNLIYYFSGTGNSLQIARDLAKKLGNVNVSSIAKSIDNEIQYPIESLGLVFPVYFGALPPIVADFISKLDIKKIKYIYAIATCNDFPGAALHIINKILKKKGKGLNAGFSITMPGNYLPMYAPLPKEKQQERFNKAEQKLNDVATIINQHEDVKVSGFGRILTFMQTINNKKLHLRDERFWVDEKCNSCGVCAKVCPVQNIEIVDGKPRWQHKCQQCMACIHWCPQIAIQVGQKTIGRLRYQNPSIKITQM